MSKKGTFSLDDVFDVIDKSLPLRFYWVCPVCQVRFFQEDIKEISQHRELLAKHIEEWKESARSYAHLIGQEVTLRYIWDNHNDSTKVHVTKNRVTGFRDFYETPEIRDFCIKSPILDLGYWLKKRQRVWLVLRDLYVPGMDRDGWDREYYVITHQIEASEINSDLTVCLSLDFEDEEDWKTFTENSKIQAK
jgi:hypothetical protein